MVFRRLGEDLHLFTGGLTTARKRDMTTALRHHVTHIFQFLLQNLEVQSGSIHVYALEPNQMECFCVSVGRVTALKAGGHGFESHLSSLFSVKIEKKGSGVRFFALPLLSKFSCSVGV